HRDARFRTGRVGLRTNADSATAFDDLVVGGILWTGRCNYCFIVKHDAHFPLTQKGSGHAPGDRPDRRTPVDAQRNLGTHGGQSLRKQLRERRASAERRPPRACRARRGYAAVPPARAQARRALADGLGRAARALLRQPRRLPPRRTQLGPRSAPTGTKCQTLSTAEITADFGSASAWR